MWGVYLTCFPTSEQQLMQQNVHGVCRALAAADRFFFWHLLLLLGFFSVDDSSRLCPEV
jgi:hypothetical protein